MKADAVTAQDMVTHLVAAVRRVAPATEPLIAMCCQGHDYGRPGMPQIVWVDAPVRQKMVSALVTDALALLGAQPAGSEVAQPAGLLALAPGRTSNRQGF